MPFIVPNVLKLRQLARVHLKIVLFLGSAVLAAVFVERFLPVLRLTVGQLSFASAFVFAWATLARLTPMEAKPHGKVEKIDQWMFWILFWIGTYLAAVAGL